MGLTLNLYIFQRSLRMIIYFSLGATALAFLADFTEFSNRTAGLEDYNTLVALGVVAMRVPFILQVAIPFIVMFATMATLMTLNQKYELVIARASGVSAWQFLLPVWVAAFIVGLFTIFVVNPVASYGFAKAEEIEGLWRSGPSQNLLLETQRPWLRQPGEDGGAVLVGATRASAVGTQIFDVSFLFIDAQGAMTKRVDAARATLSPGRWDAFDTVTIDPSGKKQLADQLMIPTSLDAAVVSEALIPAEMVPFLSLPKQINTAQSFGIPANPFRMQYHSLIALPVLLVAMTLIAATVSLRFARFGQSAGMVLSGIGAGFALYVITAVAKSFGSVGLVAPSIAAWLPAGAAIFFGVGYLLHREDG